MHYGWFGASRLEGMNITMTDGEEQDIDDEARRTKDEKDGCL